MKEDQLKKLILSAFAIALLCLLAFLSGMVAGKRTQTHAQQEVATAKKTEIFYDTTFTDMPVPRDSVVVRYVTARLPVSNAQCTMHNAQLGHDTTVRDSVEVEMPLTLTEYRDSNYVAWVSGYMATLDSIRVINRREVVTETIFVTSRKRWGFTVGPTVGAGWNGRGVEPYVGVGLTWGFSF